MTCDRLNPCSLTPVLKDLRKNKDEDHEASNRAEWMDMHEAHLAQGDSFDTCDLDLHFLEPMK